MIRMIISTKGVTLNLVWCTEKNQDKIIWRTIGSRISQKARVYITSIICLWTIDISRSVLDFEQVGHHPPFDGLSPI